MVRAVRSMADVHLTGWWVMSRPGTQADNFLGSTGVDDAAATTPSDRGTSAGRKREKKN
jgi:hypothetical protein